MQNINEYWSGENIHAQLYRTFGDNFRNSGMDSVSDNIVIVVSMLYFLLVLIPLRLYKRMSVF